MTALFNNNIPDFEAQTVSNNADGYHVVVILGPRHRDKERWPPTKEENKFAGDLLDHLKSYHNENLAVATFAGAGVGEAVKKACLAKQIMFIDYNILILGNKVHTRESFYKSRHAALVEIGSEFHIGVAVMRVSWLEDLVQRVKDQDKPLFLYTGKDYRPLVENSYTHEQNNARA